MAQKKDSAVEAAREAAARQRASERRSRTLAIVFVVAIAVLFVGAIAIIVRASGGSDAADPEYQVYDSGTLTVPTAADESYGIVVGPGGEAGAATNPDAVRVDVFEDAFCPYCAWFSLGASDVLQSMLDSGDIVLHYHPVTFQDSKSEGTRYPTRAANAMVTVAEYDPGRFLAFQEAIYSFDNQPAEFTVGLSNSKIAEIASGVGVSDEAIAKIADGEFTRWLDAGNENFFSSGFNSTPTVLVGGVDVDFRPFMVADADGNLADIRWGEGLSNAVLFVQTFGADAFAQYQTDGTVPSPLPSASAA